SFAQCFKVVGPDFTGKPEQLRPSTLPVPGDTLSFRVVVPVFQVPGCISCSFRHGANGEHRNVPNVVNSAEPWAWQPTEGIQPAEPRQGRAAPQERKPTKQSDRRASRRLTTRGPPVRKPMTNGSLTNLRLPTGVLGLRDEHRPLRRSTS